METLTIVKPIQITDGEIFDILVQTNGTFYLGYTEDGLKKVHKHFSIIAPSFEEAVHIMKISIQALFFQKYDYFLSATHLNNAKSHARFKGIGWYNFEGKLLLTLEDFHKGIYKIDGKSYSLYFNAA